MPFIKIYIHLVWSTYQRLPLLNTKELRYKVWNHIKENSKEKEIFIDTINGFSDHCHCLISLSSNQNIEKVVQLLKGESSFWINKNQLTSTKFQWQKEYFAISVLNLWWIKSGIILIIKSYIIKTKLMNKNLMSS